MFGTKLDPRIGKTNEYLTELAKKLRFLRTETGIYGASKHGLTTVEAVALVKLEKMFEKMERDIRVEQVRALKILEKRGIF